MASETVVRETYPDVQVAGEQDAKIDTSTNGDLAHVQVRHGPAWVTCRSVETVACHAYAWATAQNEATGYLPEHLPAKKTAPRRGVAAVIIRQHGYIHPLCYQSMTSRDPTSSWRTGTSR